MHDFNQNQCEDSILVKSHEKPKYMYKPFWVNKFILINYVVYLQNSKTNCNHLNHFISSNILMYMTTL